MISNIQQTHSLCVWQGGAINVADAAVTRWSVTHTYSIRNEQLEMKTRCEKGAGGVKEESQEEHVCVVCVCVCVCVRERESDEMRRGEKVRGNGK